MRFCDLTLSYTETSGGIRTVLDQKRAYLLEHTDHEHVMIVPGEDDAVEETERTLTVRIASPVLPGAAPYRFFWRPDKIRAALVEARPDVVELGSFYVCPWAAFSYQKQMREAEARRVIVGGYFHTDIADAYVGTPLRDTLTDAFGTFGERMEALGETLGDVVENAATNLLGGVFARCDLMMAATPGQIARLADYGVRDAHLVPLGVDLAAFHPRHRSDAERARYGAGPEDLVLAFGGRLDGEKHVTLLFEALERLPEDLRARTHLVVRGEGPLRAELEARAEALAASGTAQAHVLDYASDPEDFARFLASADVYVTAGPHETFALSVVEAQASGLPVVGVASGALVERVPEGLGLLGPVDDADAFAQNIAAVAEDARSMGLRGRAHVAERFAWATTFRTLVGLYEAAAARTDAPLPNDEHA